MCLRSHTLFGTFPRTCTIFLNQEAPFAIYASMTEMNFPYSVCSDFENLYKSQRDKKST